MNRSPWKLGMVLVASFIATLGIAATATEGDKQAEPSAQEAVLAGKIIDLHTHMAGTRQGAGKPKSSAQLIRNGVPVALDTDKGLVILGIGRSVSPRMIAKYADKRVELKGKLYEKAGLKYLDVREVVSNAGKAVKSQDTKSKRQRPRRTPKRKTERQ